MKKWIGPLTAALWIFFPALSQAVEPGGEGVAQLLPLRYISEQLGASVGWNAAEKEIQVDFPTLHIQLQPGKETIEVNGRQQTAGGPAVLKNSITYVSADFFRGLPHAEVSLNKSNSTISIHLNGRTATCLLGQEEIRYIGKYVGLIDGHSLEMHSEKGTDVFQISREMVERFSQVKENSIVTLYFVKNEFGQQIITRIMGIQS